jgi:hypothetical protein
MNIKSMLYAVSLVAIGVSPAYAYTYGSVKVDCQDKCSEVPIGAVCDAYVQHSRPVSIACDDTATPGYGRQKPCGPGIYCTTYGTIRQQDPVGAYCQPGDGNDAIVTCVYPPPEYFDDEGNPIEESDPAWQDKVQHNGDPLPEPPVEEQE